MAQVMIRLEKLVGEKVEQTMIAKEDQEIKMAHGVMGEKELVQEI